MSGANELEQLLGELVADGMIVRRVTVPIEDVVFFKSVLEAYPGLAAVHASRRSVNLGGPQGVRSVNLGGPQGVRSVNLGGPQGVRSVNLGGPQGVRSQGRGTTSGVPLRRVPLAVATTAELAGELDEVLGELAHTIALSA
jgi:hypothetical protein